MHSPPQRNERFFKKETEKASSAGYKSGCGGWNIGSKNAGNQYGDPEKREGFREQPTVEEGG